MQGFTGYVKQSLYSSTNKVILFQTAIYALDLNTKHYLYAAKFAYLISEFSQFPTIDYNSIIPGNNCTSCHSTPQGKQEHKIIHTPITCHHWKKDNQILSGQCHC